MNWVGGSRNRLMMKNDAKKQREFFERTKMQQKLKNMGIALPDSPRGASSGSMDLVTLFVVNQIAAKKENKDPPKVAVLSSCKGRSKHKRNDPLVLPMSPCSPSQLSLLESQPQYSVQGTRKRKHVIPQGFRCRQLSPVLESAFSDNSAPDYLLPRADLLSPFSSSSASSGQGMFPLQLNLQQKGQTQAQPPPRCSPPPWDTSGLEHAKFQPFSQPRGMIDGVSWSSGSNPAFYQLETPSAAQVLFGSPNKARDRAMREVTFSLKQAGDKDPMLDFTLNQSESEQQFEEDVFRGFSNDEYDREASHFGSAKARIYLKEETTVKSSAPQTVPDSQCMGVELSNCTDMNFSCLEHNNGCMNGCEYSPGYSCRGGYLSSDSNDDEECCQPVEHTCCTDTVNPNLGSQGNPTHRPLTPHVKPPKNTRDYHKVMENELRSDDAAQFVSPHSLSQTPSSERCKCKKTPAEVRDTGTQTFNISTPETCDASTQCSPVLDSVSKAPKFNLYLPPVDVSVQRSATGRQTGCTDAAAESTTHTDLSADSRSGGNHTPWSKTQFKAASLSGILNKVSANNSEGKGTLQRPINPLVDVMSMTDGRGMQDGEGRDERGQQGNGPLMKDLSDEAREELTSATRVNRLSEEAETLQEIADILLLLKQRKKEG